MGSVSKVHSEITVNFTAMYTAWMSCMEKQCDTDVIKCR